MTAIENASQAAAAVTWTAVCTADRVRPDRGIAALVGDQPVAIFRLSAVEGGAEEWYAVSHIDPRTGAPVIARGLVGSVGEPPLAVPTVASPLHKERFNLRTGYCLDAPEVTLTTFPIRVHNDMVEVGTPVTTT